MLLSPVGQQREDVDGGQRDAQAQILDALLAPWRE